MQSVPNDLLAATAAILTNAWLFESFLFKSKEPAERATLTAATIFIVLAIISGIGFRDHEPFGVLSGIYFLPGAVFAFFWLRSRHQRNRTPAVAEPFE